jgi:vacuolar-type H+-ATPase subunit F/Vma7
MGTACAIGEQTRVAGLALAGVTVLAAERPDAVREAFAALPQDVTLLIVTPAAADALGHEVLERTCPFAVVMPEPPG